MENELKMFRSKKKKKKKPRKNDWREKLACDGRSVAKCRSWPLKNEEMLVEILPGPVALTEGADGEGRERCTRYHGFKIRSLTSLAGVVVSQSRFPGGAQ